MKLSNSVSVLLFCKLSLASSCGTTTISSQSDADALASACPTVTGNVVLATTIAESISLDGIQVIQGGLSGGPSDSNSFISLNSSTLLSVSEGFNIASVANLASIDFPHLQTVGGPFALSDLAGLEALSITNLSSVGKFQLISAPKLSFMNLTHLSTITGPSPSVEVRSVGLAVANGVNPGTNLSSFIFSDAPNLKNFSLATFHVDYLEILGNKDSQRADALQLSIYDAAGGTFNLSGCGRITLGENPVDNIILDGNWFDFIDISGLRVHDTLAITDNQELTQVFYPDNMATVQNLQISGNVKYVYGGGESGWPWNITTTSSMIFEGDITEDAFVEHLHFNLTEVTSEFILNSTVKNFDCTFLNSLRTKGYFQGNYSCQGKTVKAGPIRTTAGNPFVSLGSTLSTSIFGTFVVLVLSIVL